MKKIFFILTFFLIIFAAVILAIAVKRNTAPVAEIKIGDNFFIAEIADTPAKQSQGLSGRESLEINKGMLFVFEKPGSYGFWMNGMKFPIDIIWISGDKIIGFEKNASLAPSINSGQAKIYYPNESVDKVLEIKAGGADNFGIKIGDSIEVLIK